MSHSVFEKLEEKVDAALEAIELLRLQLEDQEELNNNLLTENAGLKTKHNAWEQELASLLRKLENADLNPGKLESHKVEHLEPA
jgi:FtsZ-binding cell division protein ZapB